MKKEEELLKSKDVAWILDCSPDDVVEMAKRGELQGIKAGRFWRFRREDVQAYEEKQEQIATRLSPFA
jgi:excisionase family DNA binding protein